MTQNTDNQIRAAYYYMLELAGVSEVIPWHELTPMQKSQVAGHLTAFRDSLQRVHLFVQLDKEDALPEPKNPNVKKNPYVSPEKIAGKQKTKTAEQLQATAECLVTETIMPNEAYGIPEAFQSEVLSAGTIIYRYLGRTEPPIGVQVAGNINNYVPMCKEPNANTYAWLPRSKVDLHPEIHEEGM